MYGFLMGRGEGEDRALRGESNSCTHLIKRQNRQATTRSPDTEKKKRNRPSRWQVAWPFRGARQK